MFKLRSLIGFINKFLGLDYKPFGFPELSEHIKSQNIKTHNKLMKQLGNNMENLKYTHKEQFEKFNNVRTIVKNIELKLVLITRTDGLFWNLMLNDLKANTSIRWHLEHSRFTFNEVLNGIYIPLERKLLNESEKFLELSILKCLDEIELGL